MSACVLGVSTFATKLLTVNAYSSTDMVCILGAVLVLLLARGALVDMKENVIYFES